AGSAPRAPNERLLGNHSSVVGRRQQPGWGLGRSRTGQSAPTAQVVAASPREEPGHERQRRPVLEQGRPGGRPPDPDGPPDRGPCPARPARIHVRRLGGPRRPGVRAPAGRPAAPAAGRADSGGQAGGGQLRRPPGPGRPVPFRGDRLRQADGRDRLRAGGRGAPGAPQPPSAPRRPGRCWPSATATAPTSSATWGPSPGGRPAPTRTGPATGRATPLGGRPPPTGGSPP